MTTSCRKPRRLASWLASALRGRGAGPTGAARRWVPGGRGPPRRTIFGGSIAGEFLDHAQLDNLTALTNQEISELAAAGAQTIQLDVPIFGTLLNAGVSRRRNARMWSSRASTG
jgi:hypothetical protein